MRSRRVAASSTVSRSFQSRKRLSASSTRPDSAMTPISVATARAPDPRPVPSPAAIRSSTRSAASRSPAAANARAASTRARCAAGPTESSARRSKAKPRARDPSGERTKPARSAKRRNSGIAPRGSLGSDRSSTTHPSAGRFHATSRSAAILPPTRSRGSFNKRSSRDWRAANGVWVRLVTAAPKSEEFSAVAVRQWPAAATQSAASTASSAISRASDAPPTNSAPSSNTRRAPSMSPSFDRALDHSR